MTDDPQKRIEDQVAWWAVPLGLDGLRFVYEFKEDHPNEGTCSYHSNYGNVALTFGENTAEKIKEWPFRDEEETVIHELLHVLLRDMAELVDQQMMPALPKPMRKVMHKLFEHEQERAVENLARAFKAVAHADRQGPPPRVGGIVAKAGGE